jgi:hypothetical protein
MQNPREPHLIALKCFLRYLQGTAELGILLHRSSTIKLVVYTYPDWTSCPDSRQSISGYVVFLGHNLVSWSLKPQNVVSRSSAKTEYRAIANGVTEV